MGTGMRSYVLRLKTRKNKRYKPFASYDRQHIRHLVKRKTRLLDKRSKILPDLLDLFVISRMPRNSYLGESNYGLSSDHTPVIISINTVEINKSDYLQLTWRKHWDFSVNTISIAPRHGSAIFYYTWPKSSVVITSPRRT